jgi:nucleoid DNA-binding protein
VARPAKAHPYLTQRQHEEIVTVFFGTIADELADGDRIELRGF